MDGKIQHHRGRVEMSNKNYIKGVKLEREVVNIFKDKGWIAMRTAGSHSPFDVILIKESFKHKKICFVAFVQCKVKSS